MTMRVKKVFTLLEMVIALLILSIIGALTGVQVKKMIDKHRFEGEISNLFITLQEAQILSAVYQTDLKLDIFKENHHFAYRFSTHEPFPAHKLNQNAIALAHSAFIKFKGAKVSHLHFDIYSGGRIEPRGILAFYLAQEDDNPLWFDLQYGHLIKFSYRRPALLKQQIPNI